MMWPRERWSARHRHEDVRADVKEFATAYLVEPWRTKAVKVARLLVRDHAAAPRDEDSWPRAPSPEALAERLHEADLTEVAALVEASDRYGSSRHAGAILGEAAALHFCAAPSLTHWRLVASIFENDLFALEVVVRTFHAGIARTPSVGTKLRGIARRIVSRSVREPAGHLRAEEVDFLKRQQDKWHLVPSLRDIWFGLRAMDHVMAHRPDDFVFDLLFRIDTAFAAELIEEYGAPYLPSLVLRFSAFDPAERYEDWALLVKHAAPSFDEDGSWNSRVLLPMLLGMAHDALRGAGPHLDAPEEEVERYDAETKALVMAATGRVLERPDGAAASLHWAAWSYRSTLASLHDEGRAFPHEASRGRGTWMVCEALAEDGRSTTWLGMRPGAEAEDEPLTFEAVRILAAAEHGMEMPPSSALHSCLPDTPEQWLDGPSADRLRERTQPFTTWLHRPDALGVWTLARPLFGPHAVRELGALWRRTLPLRELMEHRRATDDRRDGAQPAFDAASIIRLVASLGIALLDGVQDNRMNFGSNRQRACHELFDLMYDITRELLALAGPYNRDETQLHDHLIVRRMVYDEAHPNNADLAAPLSDPTIAPVREMLSVRLEVSPSFFDCLGTLRRNGVALDRIEDALRKAGAEPEHLLTQAQRWNAIEAQRQIETAPLRRESFVPTGRELS